MFNDVIKKSKFLPTGGSQNAKVKQFHYRPGQALRVPGSQIIRQSSHEDEKFSLTHRPPLPPRKYSWQ
jgi:hypothetical protein